MTALAFLTNADVLQKILTRLGLPEVPRIPLDPPPPRAYPPPRSTRWSFKLINCLQGRVHEHVRLHRTAPPLR